MEYAAKLLQGMERFCILVAGDKARTDYSASARVCNFLADNCTGLIIRYANSRCYYYDEGLTNC